MKKILAFAFFTLCLKNGAQAQLDTRPVVFSFVPEVSLPIGKFGETNKLGFGGGVTGQFYLAEKLRLLTIAGGTLHQGKTYMLDQYFEDQYPAVALLGLKGGVKYYLANQFFVAGTIGADMVTQQGEKKIGFAYAPLLGAELGGVDIYAKYNSVGVKSVQGSAIQTVSFCLGYRL